MHDYRKYITSPEFRVAGMAFVSASLLISITRYYTDVFPVLWLLPFAVYLCSIWATLTEELNENHDRLLLSHAYIVLPLLIPLSFPVPAGLFIYISCLLLLFINSLVAHVEIRRQAAHFHAPSHYILSITIGAVTGIAVALTFARTMPEKLAPLFLSVVLLCLLRSQCKKLYSDQSPLPFTTAPLWETLAIPSDLKASLAQEKQAILNQYTMMGSWAHRLSILQENLQNRLRNWQKKIPLLPHLIRIPAEYQLVAKFLSFCFLIVALAAGHRLLLPLTASPKEFILVIYMIAYCLIVTSFCFTLRYHSLQFGFGLGLVLLGNSILLHPLRLDGADITPIGLGASAEILMLFSALILASSIKSPVLLSANSRYGTLKVVHNRINDSLELINNNVIHGAQLCDDAQRNEPISYYARKGPFGQLFPALAQTPGSDAIAVIGLGVGTIAAYGRKNQTITFYEINPLIEQIACHTGYFSYTQHSQADIKVVLGDARETFSQAKDDSVGVLICDAYTGDNIPKHLLTREAFVMYLQKLQEHGVILINITNRHINLAPVLAKIAEDLGLAGYYRKYQPGTKKQGQPPLYQGGLIAGKKSALSRQSDPVLDDFMKTLQSFFAAIGLTPDNTNLDKRCTWAVLARTQEDLTMLQGDARWLPLPAAATQVLWTDDMAGYDSWTKSIETMD